MQCLKHPNLLPICDLFCDVRGSGQALGTGKNLCPAAAVRMMQRRPGGTRGGAVREGLGGCGENRRGWGRRTREKAECDSGEMRGDR